MLVKKSEPIRMEKRFDGAGHLYMQKLLEAPQLGNSADLYGIATLEQGCSIGVHKHSGNTETYHILQGTALYNDDDATYTLKAGDTVFCEEGHTHGIANNGATPLVFVALVLKA